MEYRRASASERLLTLEEFERLPEEDGFDLELVRGRLVREPAPAPRHGQLSVEPPDLAVEILSPSNRYSEIQEKVTEYLEGGSRLVWVVDPRKRSVTDYRSRHAVRVLTGREELDGDPVLEGFRLPLGDLFGE